jgi:hypothetical protein
MTGEAGSLGSRKCSTKKETIAMMKSRIRLRERSKRVSLGCRENGKLENVRIHRQIAARLVLSPISKPEASRVTDGWRKDVTPKFGD